MVASVVGRIAQRHPLGSTHVTEEVRLNDPSPKKMGLFSKIASRDDALKVAKDTSSALFFLAVLQGAQAYWVGLSVLFDAVIYAIGGFFVRRFHSRAAAIIVLVLALVGAVVTFGNRVGANLGGGNNVILATLVVWAAVRAVESTFKLHGRFAHAVTNERGGAQ